MYKSCFAGTRYCLQSDKMKSVEGVFVAYLGYKYYEAATLVLGLGLRGSALDEKSNLLEALVFNKCNAAPK